MKATNKQSGFTLVETLVSLALLSVLAVFGLEAIRLQQRLNREQERIARQIEVQAAIQTMASELESALPVFAPNQAGKLELEFKGTDQSIQFVGLSDGSRLEGGTYRIKFFLRDDHTLVATFAVFTPKGAVQPIDIEMLKNVASINFEYAETAGGNTFQDTWSDPTRLPRQVIMTISDELSPQIVKFPTQEMVEIETAAYR